MTRKSLGKHHANNNHRAKGKLTCGECNHFDAELENCKIRYRTEDKHGNPYPADEMVNIKRKADFVQCLKFQPITK